MSLLIVRAQQDSILNRASQRATETEVFTNAKFSEMNSIGQQGETFDVFISLVLTKLQGNYRYC